MNVEQNVDMYKGEASISPRAIFYELRVLQVPNI